MQNQSTSARTAAKYSSKCSLLFRQAPILAILMLAAVFSSCNTPTAETVEDGDGYNVIVIDSCEYIEVKGMVGANNGYYSITHKGNCKLCAARHSR